MPYGNKSELLKGGYAVHMTIQGTGWSYVSTSGRQCAALTQSRSGTNSSSAALRAASGDSPVFLPVRKLFKVYDGPRIAIITGYRKNGKPIFRRDYRYVYRYIMVKQKRKAPRLSLPPNTLSTTSTRIKPFGDTEVSASHPSGITQKFSGALWNVFSFINYGTNANAGDPAWFGVPDSNETLENELSSAALQRLYSSVKDQQVNMGQVVAERGQTARLLADSFGRLVRFLLATKRGDIVKATRILFPGNSKQVASDYLAYQYGVKPLISDITGLVSSLGKERTETFSAFGRSSRTLKDQVTSVATQTYGCKVTTVTTESLEVTVLYKATFAITHPGLRSLGEYGITNPVSLAWEILPWSFVLDWLLPVGNYLNNLDATTGARLLYCHKSVLYKRKVKVTRVYGGKDIDNYEWSYANCGFECESVRFGRTVLSVLPDLPLPVFKNPFSATHVANLAALLRTLRR